MPGFDEEVEQALSGGTTQPGGFEDEVRAALAQPEPPSIGQAPFNPQRMSGPEKETLGTKLMDFAAPAANSLAFGFGDELAGMVGGDDAKAAVRDRLALANRRSPWLAGAGNIAGGMAPALMTGGASLPVRAAASIGAGALQGAGNADAGNRAEGAAWGGAGGAFGASLGAVPGVISKMGADKIPQALGAMAGAGTRVGGMLGGLLQGGGWQSTGVGGLVGGYVAPAIEKGVEKVAGAFPGATQTALKGAAQAGMAAGPMAAAAVSGVKQGNQLPSTVERALQLDPASLGAYSGQLQEVAEDPGKLRAKVSQLYLNEPDFRQYVENLK